MVDPGVALDDGPADVVSNGGRRFPLGLAVVTVGAFLLRVSTLANIASRNPDGGDPYYYHVQANFLVQGHGFSDPFVWRESHQMVPSAIHPPLYSLWLAIPTLFGQGGYTAHKIMSCLAGALTVAMIGILARKVAGPRAGLVAALLAAIYPPLWSIDGQLWPEGFFTGLVALACWCAYRAREEPGWRTAAAVGAAVAAATLTRGEAIGLAPLLVVPMILLRRGRPGRREWTDLTVAGVACLAVLAPWMIRNAATFEHFVPLSTNSDEVWVYANNPWAYGTEDGGTFLGFWYYPWQDQLRAESGEPRGDASEKARYWREQGVEYANQHRDRLPIVVAARVGRAWNVYAPFQNARFDQIDGKRLWVSQLGVFAWWAALALALPGAWLLRRRRVTIIPFVALATLVTVTAIYAYGANRFRTPLDLAALVLAAVTIDHLLTRFTGRGQMP